MYEGSPIARENANKSTVIVTDKSDSNGDDTWFSEMCRDVFGPGAGATMACLTSVDERYCWRYAASTVPKAPFLRLLLRSERGEAVFNYVMDGCTAAWWREHKLLARKAALFDQAKRIMAEIAS